MGTCFQSSWSIQSFEFGIVLCGFCSCCGLTDPNQILGQTGFKDSLSAQLITHAANLPPSSQGSVVRGTAWADRPLLTLSENPSKLSILNTPTHREDITDLHPNHLLRVLRGGTLPKILWGYSTSINSNLNSQFSNLLITNLEANN